MPYIEPESKKRFEQIEADLLKTSPKNAGELNYIFTKTIQSFFEYQPKVNYQAFNDAIGALEGCKMELYRRQIAVYEDRKIFENGDVY